MKISVIIPVHNSEKTIENCVQRIVEQNAKYEKQIILVENGSIDKTLSTCQSLSTKYIEVECYSCSIIGPSAARNLGLEKAIGDIICFCDSDDCYLPNSIDNVMDIFAKNEELQMIIGGMETIKGDGLDWLRKKRLHTEYLYSIDISTRILCDSKIMGSVCNKFYRRGLLENIRFNEKLFYCEDTYFNFEIIKRNNPFKVYTIREIVYSYIKTGSSATNNTKRLFDENNDLKYISTMKEIEKNFTITESEKNALDIAKYIYAVDAYSSLGVDNVQKKNLILYIKNGYSGFKKSIGKDTLVRYIKFLIKGQKIIKSCRY